MNKKFIIPLVSLGVVVASAASILLANQNTVLNRLQAGTGVERNGQIVFDGTSDIDVYDDSGTPYQVFFKMTSHTKSGYVVDYDNNIVDCSVGGETEPKFKKEIDDETYICYSSGSYAGSAYFNISFVITNLYNFIDVVVDGQFVRNNDTVLYEKIFDKNDSDVVDYDDGTAYITLSSADLEGVGYKSVALKSITVNYMCID